jgi:phospholipid transport system substrate-binding protein
MLWLSISLSSWAGEPTDRIKTAEDNLISVMSDMSLRPPEMKDKRDRMIMEVVDRVFSWEDFSRSALGTNWKERTSEEKKEFVSLLRQLIVNSYVDYVTRYSGEKIEFADEKIERDYGIVDGQIITSAGKHIPVAFRVIKKAGLWWIYDINVEGLSFAGYYRNQINAIITRSSYKELLKSLRDKVNAGAGQKNINN